MSAKRQKRRSKETDCNRVPSEPIHELRSGSKAEQSIDQGPMSGGTAREELKTSLSDSMADPIDCYPVPSQSTADHCVLCTMDTVSSTTQQDSARSHDVERMEYVVLPTHQRHADRWMTVRDLLSKAVFSSFEDLQALISSYNKHVFNFQSLQEYFEGLEPSTRDRILGEVLPKVAALACELDVLFQKPIPKLATQRQMSITMSQRQVACLMANVFFCTLMGLSGGGHTEDDREAATEKRRQDLDRYTTVNLGSMFAPARRPGRQRSKVAKLACILHYFDRVTSDDCELDGVVTYIRRVLTKFPDWSTSAALLGRVHVASLGLIDVDGAGMLQVDFANKHIGGGVLCDGCVQEEIRFVVCPELIVARLLAPDPMSDNESIIVVGCERFSDTTGYADTFRWMADHRDETPVDRWGRRRTEVVAIDATPFRSNFVSQFSQQSITRETNKAYCGFFAETATTASAAGCHSTAVASGNWGCGAFRGDHRLKALLQMIACAASGRDLCYFTFGDGRLCQDIVTFYEHACRRQLNVGQLWKSMMRYCEVLRAKKSSKSHRVDILTFIMNEWSNDNTSL